MEFLVWLEQSGFGTWVRESESFWAYPAFLILHTIGMGFLVGINASIDLRILGFVPRIPVAPMEPLFPIMWAGFWVNAFSGVVITISHATTMLTNPVMYLKFLFVGLAVAIIPFLKSQVFGNPGFEGLTIPMKGKILAGASLACWAGAITFGRLTAYIHPNY